MANAISNFYSFHSCLSRIAVPFAIFVICLDYIATVSTYYGYIRQSWGETGKIEWAPKLIGWLRES